MTFQRMMQLLSFLVFALLLWLASFPLTAWLPFDLFLRLDPLVAAGTWLSTRMWIPALWAALVVLVFTWLLGRFFCSTICPMGATVDAADHLLRSGKRGRKHTLAFSPVAAKLRAVKYHLLAFVLGAALLGVSLVFLASPISLVTRFFGVIVHPVLSLLTDRGLTALRPIANHFNLTALAYAQVEVHRFDLQWVTILLFAGIFACSLLAPRFWCRYLCPSGALFALFSRKPLIRRRVSGECTDCGRCIKSCPMNAIEADPRITRHDECIVCETCVRVCPVNAVSFRIPVAEARGLSSEMSPLRRKMLWSGLSGIGAGLITLTGLNHLSAEQGPGQLHLPELIRPPGAMPEDRFLARCIRCGECLKACPTNTLQPSGLAAGFAGFYSPKMTPRRGPCEPLCNVCGQVCPTGAIRPLPRREKTRAKIGTAYILRHKCLAWEFGRKCLVCDEVCPYDAIDLKRVAEIPVGVPFVNENRCSGCGFCEYHCPVRATSAIVVEPMGELRLASGSYREKGRELGLVLDVRKRKPAPPPPESGESEAGDGGLPPGFTE